MSKRVRVSLSSDTAVVILGPDGGAPSGGPYQDARQALHLAAAQAGGSLDQPGHGPTCLDAPRDRGLAVGVIACFLAEKGYAVEVTSANAPAFDVP